MSRAKPVPGKVTAKQTRDGWMWRWESPLGTPHLGADRHETEAKALAAGRRFARKQTSRRPVEDDQ
ncbi:MULTISPECIES: hypothetical protein [Mycolicibacterium]|uniref:DUF2188 domain-containing protein n=1 Tax=Mycobacterium phage Bipper TaxID=1805457 RepID=A0A142F2I8_9CAUD|nr:MULTISPECIES: hypothetical protein [Mycolicibacterium]YP_009303207.1 hypothetical protein KCH39_gp117 [Mycobacterium phage Bipper]QDF19346.1 hypothetical protein SEA_CRACKLEWINK_60 [Mycobacterium phage Cracklewink]AMQ66995.1 hypothetical protein SEA_BIPPER_60 [Mycobacterium phage Bipper]MCC9181164.1 hypothetical protein [Mycolicibacterium mageritense]UBV14865.1 hypothetical protein H8Z57_29945 [Mycolicibacterium fortuitum]